MKERTNDPAKFRSMIDGTQQDWDIIAREQKEFAPNNGKRILDHLKLLGGDYGGFPVDRLEHCLQTATRAHRDGRDEEYVVMALLHDIGDTLGALIIPMSRRRSSNPFCQRKISGSFSITGFSRAIISSTILASTATCATSSKTARIMRRAPNFARSMKRRRSLPITTASRSSFSNRW